jgi:DNA repair protein RadA/Sms
MAQSKTLFSCSHCDAQFPKWSGRCLECGKWGTLSETADTPKKKADVKTTEKFAEDLQPLSSISSDAQPRIQTKTQEFDSVLGGGIVPGSLILLGGDPGIGKSTISLQILHALESASPLYISGEESGQQVKLRATRLGIAAEKINYLSETNIETITGSISKHKPGIVIVDSIQTIYSNDVESEPGSVTQVRACTVKLLETAKTSNIPIILIGHVTKDGQVAGPKTLEHLVDTVLYLEGDRYHTFRILRTVKNRFGPTNEVGVFEMTSKGLEGVKNPSSLFISSQENLPGSAVTCILEGTRPFLIEIQALVIKSSYASPQRRASGYDVNRLQLLLAVLQQKTKHAFANMDVHINVVGGIQLKDPATDLAVCSALISALTQSPSSAKTIILGEVGLAGEVRPVRQLAERLKEAKKLGYDRAVIPKQKTKSLIETDTLENIASL